jgi:hypothetical protein
MIGETLRRFPKIRRDGDISLLRSHFIDGVKHMPSGCRLAYAALAPPTAARRTRRTTPSRRDGSAPSDVRRWMSRRFDASVRRDRDRVGAAVVVHRDRATFFVDRSP